MVYIAEIKPSCKKDIDKACKRNPLLRTVLENKISEVILNPHHYKPLRYDLKGERRVHILKSFVLKFEVDEASSAVIFLTFEHHDDAYKR